MINQLEVCRGTNVSLSNKLTKLEETVRILQSKNIYLQEENQRLKAINEVHSQSKESAKNPIQSSPTFPPPENTNARVLLLENENITNKIKLVEQSFNNQLTFLKMEMEKKMSDLELTHKNSFPQRDRNFPALRKLTSKQDDLNNRLRKVEYTLEENQTHIKKKVVDTDKPYKTSSSKPEEKSNEEVDNTHFTPILNKSFHLPFQKSLSEELQACSSPELGSFTNENSRFPTLPPGGTSEEILLEETTDSNQVHSDEELLEENVNVQLNKEKSFLEKGPSKQSSS